MKYNSTYNAKKHGKKYIILHWSGQIINFGKKSIIIFDDLLDADQYLDEQMDKMSKSIEEEEIIKNDYNNNFDKWFEDTRGEFYILKCKNVFTNYICDPFGFSKAINL
jgi:hypothetical protein